jgi:hypothetical protein
VIPWQPASITVRAAVRTSGMFAAREFLSKAILLMLTLSLVI